MLDKETLLTVFDGTVKSLIFNLDFIPADKLDWKPAPEAKSALEIVNHLTEYLGAVSRRLDSQDSAFSPATNNDEAKRVLAQVRERYIAAVRGASAEALNGKFHEEHDFTTGWMASAAIIDTLYHSGQIAYIQTLLGDSETHFDVSSLADLRQLWPISP